MRWFVPFLLFRGQVRPAWLTDIGSYVFIFTCSHVLMCFVESRVLLQ